MSQSWTATTTSDRIARGTVVRLPTIASGGILASSLLNAGFDVVTSDGAVNRGRVVAAIPGSIVVRLAATTIYLVPAPVSAAGPFEAALGGSDGEWIVDHIETNLGSTGAASADLLPQQAEPESDFSEGQLPGMPVSHDPMRELGPTPSPDDKAQD